MRKKSPSKNQLELRQWQTGTRGTDSGDDEELWRGKSEQANGAAVFHFRKSTSSKQVDIALHEDFLHLMSKSTDIYYYLPAMRESWCQCKRWLFTSERPGVESFPAHITSDLKLATPPFASPESFTLPAHAHAATDKLDKPAGRRCLSSVRR